MSKALRDRSVGLSPQVCGIAWKAQKRLHGRLRRMIGRGKPPGEAATAAARELAGFVWAIAREAVGPDIRIAVDANQRWDRDQAIEWIRALEPFDLAWVEEPTSPDDVLAHAAIAQAIAPIPVATGEHGMSRVLFKQLLQAGAASVVQIDSTRVAGVNENIAILLLAAKFGVPVCPHAGGVGLCEAVQHFSMFDFVAVSGSQDGRMIEYTKHLHEHFVTPVEVAGGRYRAALAPGTGMEMLPASLSAHEYRVPQPA